jgi:carboxymethylenebutenolidase
MKDRINIEGHDGAFAAYVARPKTLPVPAVVCSAGVVRGERRHPQNLAEQGFVAVAPDPAGAGRRPEYHLGAKPSS